MIFSDMNDDFDRCEDCGHALPNGCRCMGPLPALDLQPSSPEEKEAVGKMMAEHFYQELVDILEKK